MARTEVCTDCANPVPVVHVVGTATEVALVPHTVTETRSQMAGAYGEIKRTISWECPGSGRRF